MSFIIPTLIFLLIIWALFKKQDVYSSFLNGAKEALPMLVKTLPAMTAMLMTVTLAQNSGLMDAVSDMLAPMLALFGIDKSLTALLLLRPFSGNGALALLSNVFKTHGADSLVGMTASNMLGSTETVFYTASLYFGSVGIKRTRYAVFVALVSGLVGNAAAIILTPYFL